MSDKDKLFVVMSILNNAKAKIKEANAGNYQALLGNYRFRSQEAEFIIDYIFAEIKEQIK
jgi:hypothetical protein